MWAFNCSNYVSTDIELARIELVMNLNGCKSEDIWNASDDIGPGFGAWRLLDYLCNV